MVILEGVLNVYYTIGFNPFHCSVNFNWYDQRKWFLLVFVLYSLIPQITYTVVNFHEILKSTKSMASTMVTLNCLGKISVHILYKCKIKDFIEELDNFIENLNRESAKVFVKIEKRMDKLFCFYNWFCWINTVVYGITPALYQTYMFIAGKASDDIFVMPFDTEYFFDSSKRGVYQICYFNGFFSLLSSVQMIVCVDSFFLGSCIYIGEMFGSLDVNLRELNSSNESGDCNDERTVEFNESLKTLLKDHNQVLSIIGKLNEIYGPIVLIQLLTSKIMISVLLFQSFYVGTVVEYILFLAYLSVALYQLFIYCYGGAVLSYASQKFATNVYDLNWYQYPIWAQKCILLILGVAQKTQIVGGTLFQACDLTAFCQILKIVYLTFTVLNSLQ